jgi:peptidoglycan/xylan/chitin deacetylase (PgdA/CDA1 family)
MDQGVGTNFCSVPDNCQTAFGRCDSEMFPEGASTLKDPRPKLGNLPYGQAIMDCRVPGTIAMTFDDGPSEYTGELLDKLRAAGAKATFFVGANNNGRQIDQGPVWAALIRRMVDEGHQVGSHTWSHPHMDNITTEERKLEMTKTERAIANIINRYPTYMRPPYSQCDTPGCRQDMIGMGYNVIGCLVDTEDWRHVRNFTASVEVVKERFRSFNSMPFSIICQHDIIQDSVRVLTPVVLDQIKAKGLKAVTVGECLGENDASWYRKPGSGLSWKASDRLGH